MLLVCGCEALGPRTLQSGRPDYNTAIQKTDVAQILLNIVRLRFVDRPYFLEVTSISSTAQVSALLGGAEPDGVFGSLSYLERPNIIYSPLTGEDFIRQMLTRVDLNTLDLVTGAGWELDDVFRVFVQSIYGIPNAPIAAGPTPEGVPEFEEFLQLVEAIDELDDLGALVLAPSETSEDELVIYVNPVHRDLPELARFRESDGWSPRRAHPANSKSIDI